MKTTNLILAALALLIAAGCDTTQEDTAPASIDTTPPPAAPMNDMPRYHPPANPAPVYQTPSYPAPMPSSPSHPAPMNQGWASTAPAQNSNGSMAFHDTARDYAPPAPQARTYPDPQVNARTYESTAPLLTTTVTTDASGAQEVVVSPATPAAMVGRWTSYKDIWFDLSGTELHTTELDKVQEIASFMKDNPTMTVGLDGSHSRLGSEGATQGLTDRRVSVVQDALLQAGVSSSRIQTGKFGNPELRRERRVEVLLVSTNGWDSADLAR